MDTIVITGQEWMAIIAIAAIAVGTIHADISMRGTMSTNLTLFGVIV